MCFSMVQSPTLENQCKHTQAGLLTFCLLKLQEEVLQGFCRIQIITRLLQPSCFVAAPLISFASCIHAEGSWFPWTHHPQCPKLERTGWECATSDCLSGKDLWEAIGIKRHLLKLALLLLHKAQEIFTREKVFLEILSFRSIQALKISKILLIIGFVVHMSLKSSPVYLSKIFLKRIYRKFQLFALPDKNHSILTTWWALGVN